MKNHMWKRVWVGAVSLAPMTILGVILHTALPYIQEQGREFQLIAALLFEAGVFCSLIFAPHYIISREKKLEDEEKN